MRPAGRAPPTGPVAPPGGHNLRALAVSWGSLAPWRDGTRSGPPRRRQRLPRQPAISLNCSLAGAPSAPNSWRRLEAGANCAKPGNLARLQALTAAAPAARRPPRPMGGFPRRQQPGGRAGEGPDRRASCTHPGWPDALARVPAISASKLPANYRQKKRPEGRKRSPLLGAPSLS